MQEYRKQVWLSYEEWTEDDVIHLLLGREPLVPFLGDMPEGWEDFLCSAHEAVRHSGLARTVTPHGVSFNPRDVIEWAGRHKKEWPWFPFHSEDEFPSDDSPRKPRTADQAETPNEAASSNYTTRLLEAVYAARKEHWDSFNPDDVTTAPKAATVREWLKKNHGVSGRMAMAIATILRGDEVRTGPRHDSPQGSSGRIHTTYLLDAMEAARKRYWDEYAGDDISAAKTNKVIVEWLLQEYGESSSKPRGEKMSKFMAQSMATILRKDGLRTGVR